MSWEEFYFSEVILERTRKGWVASKEMWAKHPQKDFFQKKYIWRGYGDSPDNAVDDLTNHFLSDKGPNNIFIREAKNET